MEVLQNIIGRLFIAIPICVIWSVTSFFISYTIYKIKKKDMPEDFFNDCKIITDYILIFLYLLFFYKENIKLF